MILQTSLDADGSRCTLTYDAANEWLRATWHGFVDPAEAQRGAQHYLNCARGLNCPYLLNNNRDLRGAWFDAVEWLQEVWLPRALELGLRYVAHVVQADTRTDILTLSFPRHLVDHVELQVFEEVAHAEAWLRSCQRRPASKQGLKQ